MINEFGVKKIPEARKYKLNDVRVITVLTLNFKAKTTRKSFLGLNRSL